MQRKEIAHWVEPETIDAGPSEAVRGPRRIGFMVILAFIVIFGVWGGLAPLSGGAFAPGTIAPFGSVRTIQHLEGGIIERILVQDGDTVEPGDPLLEMKSVASASEVAAMLDRRRAKAAEAARLAAELNGAREIDFPPDLLADPTAATVMAAESRILRARDTMIDARKQMLGQRIEQLKQQITGYSAQVQSTVLQLDLVNQEISDKSQLLAQGLSPKVELLRLQRDAAQIRGFEGEYMASIAAARGQIAEAETELLAIDAERREQVSEKAGAIRGELAEIEQVLEARRDVLARTIITAPVAGVVNNLRVKTEGGVIGSGQAILDIVPTEEKLVINAMVMPMDIDKVKVGMASHVQLPAIASRKTPQVKGIVTNVSAESVTNPQTGQPHYFARVEVAQSELETAKVEGLLVGMPAYVIIVSQERTMMQYLMQPFTDALWRAGREV
jgi:HlyD family secretion protein